MATYPKYYESEYSQKNGTTYALYINGERISGWMTMEEACNAFNNIVLEAQKSEVGSKGLIVGTGFAAVINGYLYQVDQR